MAESDPEKYDYRNIPEDVKKDELDDYLRYQDEVIRENDRAFEVLMKEQENRLEKIEEKEEMRIRKLYDIPDKMTPIDEALQKRIDERDRAVAERIRVLDERTDRFEKELERAIEEKKKHLSLIGQNIAESAREAEETWRHERNIQKEINRIKEVKKEEIWDEGTVVTVVDEKKETGVEEQGEGERAAEGQEKKEETVSGEKMSREEKVREYGRDRRKARKEDEARWKAYEDRRARDVGVTVPKVAIPVQTEGGAVPVKEEKTGGEEVMMPPRIQGQVYPCPVCGSPLVWYEKYQRWWCRRCKKWR